MFVLLDSMDKVKDFVDVVSGFASDVDLESGRFMVDAKSILGIISLNLSKPLQVLIRDKSEEEKIKQSISGFLY